MAFWWVNHNQTFQAPLHRNQEAVESALLQKGLFVIASNNLDETALSSLTMVHTYKMQGQTVEGSIRWEPCRGDPEGMIRITHIQLKVVSFFFPGVRRYYGLGADS